MYKRQGDIGSTSVAYAVGHIGKVKVGEKSYAPFDEDFVTVNPYLGSDGINPFIDVCKEEKKGLFILVKTSNPSSGEFQDLIVDGRPLYELVGEKVAQWGEDLSLIHIWISFRRAPGWIFVCLKMPSPSRLR